ncbi:hypothetical protein C0J52_14221 [Blattella germanica]|nr:hypothetical protein C0J52_14221 [Blattella germanica]
MKNIKPKYVKSEMNYHGHTAPGCKAFPSKSTDMLGHCNQIFQGKDSLQKEMSEAAFSQLTFQNFHCLSQQLSEKQFHDISACLE